MGFCDRHSSPLNNSTYHIARDDTRHQPSSSSSFTYGVGVADRVDPQAVVLTHFAEVTQEVTCFVVDSLLVPRLDEQLEVERVRPVMDG